MLMVDTLVSGNVMLNTLSLSLYPSPSPPSPPSLSISPPTWALWWECTCRVSRTSSVSFSFSGWRGSSGWLASCSPFWLFSCAAPVLVCTYMLFTHTHTHTHTHTRSTTNNVGHKPVFIAKSVDRVHAVSQAAAVTLSRAKECGFDLVFLPSVLSSPRASYAKCVFL